MSAPVRIAHVLAAADGGGLGHALQLAEDAREHGAVPVFALPAPAEPVRDFPTVAIPAGAIARVRALARLARSADVLHVHGPRAASWALPVLPACRSVVTFHGLHPLRRPASRPRREAGRALIGAEALAARAVVCVSDSEAADLRRWCPGVGDVHVVRNGIAPQPRVDAAERAAARAALALPDGTFAVLVLGRLTEAKDPLLALAVAEAVAAAAPAPVVFLFAGDGELRAEVEAAAGPAARLLGARSDVRALLAASDVLLSTSIWEGMPLAVLEAMAVGLPVVAADIPANAEALGTAGVLVPRTVEAFRDGLLGLRDAEARRTLADAAAARVRAEFPLAGQLAGTADVYAHVLGRRPW